MSAAHRWLSKVASHVLEAPPQDVESALHGQEAVNAFLNGASPNRLLLYYQPAEGVRRGAAAAAPLASLRPPPPTHPSALPHAQGSAPSVFLTDGNAVALEGKCLYFIRVCEGKVNVATPENDVNFGAP